MTARRRGGGHPVTPTPVLHAWELPEQPGYIGLAPPLLGEPQVLGPCPGTERGARPGPLRLQAPRSWEPALSGAPEARGF